MAVGCRRYAAHFSAVGSALYTTSGVNAARFLAVGVGVMLPILLLLAPPFTRRRRLMLPVFGRWCRRHAAHFTTVGVALHTTARVNAARFSSVGVDAMLPISLLLVPRFALRVG